MAKIKKPYVSPQAPFENISETQETPDIEAFRAFAPDTTILNAATNAQFENARRNITDSYGAYSGIPSQVARNQLRDEALNDLESSRATALAEGSERAQALKLSQLEALAGLTAKRKQSGYNTQIIQPQPSGILPAIFGGGASAGTAAIIA
jgi:hypothetical protein